MVKTTEKVSGYIDHIIFHNEENGYTVMVLGCPGGRKLTCVGTLPGINEGLTIEAEGDFVIHNVYGRQLQIRSYTEKTPQDQDGIERYLSSGAIKGIGAALAARIVRRFGADTLRIIEEEPEQLAQIKGISKKMALAIGEQASEKRQMRRAMIFLQKYGISLSLGARIYQRYGEEVYQVLRENPYRMAEDIRGVGFLTADEIAGRIGIHVDSDYRIRSGLIYILNQAQSEGHIYLPKDQLLARSQELLGVETAFMEKHLMDLMLERKIVVRAEGKEAFVYLTVLYRMEQQIASMLSDLNVTYDIDDTLIRDRLRQVEKETGLILDTVQKKAVELAARHGVLILTGGPGTGKTTTINAMIRYFSMEESMIMLAAPTGRAAKRMTEATGFSARTIHRMLEISGLPEDDEPGADIHFERNRSNPLEAQIIMIDEMSMVDIYLMHALLEAVPPGARLILVGDENQLPSVGPGNILKDMIASKVFQVVELTQIFRQARESDIIVNAHRINHGESFIPDNRSRDFFLLKRQEAEQVLRVMLSLVREKLPPYVQAKPYEIQVLTPMRKGVLGVENLNRVLQFYLNPPSPEKKEHESGDHVFREGDKVMQIRNNYQLEWEIRGRKGYVIENGLGVFNGDMGILSRIDEREQVATVEFEESRFADYSFRQLEELELAYAVTIHKSQGSEYPAVVLPLLTGPQLLMNRNLLYTAVTRARKCVTIVGSEQTFTQMILNERQLRRYSSLDLAIRKIGI